MFLITIKNTMLIDIRKVGCKMILFNYFIYMGGLLLTILLTQNSQSCIVCLLIYILFELIKIRYTLGG